MFLDATRILNHLLTFGFYEDGSTKKVYRLSHPILSHHVHIKKPAESKKLILAIPVQYAFKVSEAKKIPVHGGIEGKSSNYKGYTPAGGSSNPALTFDFKGTDELSQFVQLMFGLTKALAPAQTDKSFESTNTESKTLTKVRIGQDKFREDLKDYWNNACSVTGCTNQSLLVASHIIPWHEDESSRLEVSNGLLLTPNLDAAFDKGYISFNDDGSILLSSELAEDDLKALNLSPSLALRDVNPKHLPYLAWHRANLFKA